MADTRRLRGHHGRFDRDRVNVHLFPIGAVALTDVDPFHFGEGRYSCDPAGRALPLFRPGRDPNPPTGECHRALEEDLPAPIPCRLLGSASYQLDESLLERLRAGTLHPAHPAAAVRVAARLGPFLGFRFRTFARLTEVLRSLAEDADEEAALESAIDHVRLEGLTADSPKHRLLAEAAPWTDPALVVRTSADPEVLVRRGRIEAAALSDFGDALVARGVQAEVLVDPERGTARVLDEGSELRVPLHHVADTFPAGATPRTRDRELESDATPVPTSWIPSPVPTDSSWRVEDSRTYEWPDDIGPVSSLAVGAADGERPYVFHEDPTLTIEGDDGELVLEGIHLGLLDPSAAPLPEGTRAPLPLARVRLTGSFDRVVIRQCTFDPGGVRAAVEGAAQPLPITALAVSGLVRELVVVDSIMGPIGEVPDASDPDGGGRIESLAITRSIIQDLRAAGWEAGTDDDALPLTRGALCSRRGHLRLEETTVFGDVVVESLHADAALVDGYVRVVDDQHGCFRFSAAHGPLDRGDGSPGSRFPPRFQSHVPDGPLGRHVFVTRRFGATGFARLSRTAPRAIRRGAEHGTEMGVYRSLHESIRRDDLERKHFEYLPVGLIPQLILD